VEIVHPLTVMVLADTDPGPPTVDELDTDPPPACTWTPVLPAELLLETVPALLLPDDAPAALMLPSACFSTETVQLSPEVVLPFFTIVSAFEVTLSIAVSANATATVHARVMCNSSRGEIEKGGRRVPSPKADSVLVLPHFVAFAAVVVLVMALAVFHASGAGRGAGSADSRAALSAASR